MSQQLIDYLEQVYKRIENPENWTQKASARDCNGSSCWSQSEDAVRWCLDGAMLIEGKLLGIPELYRDGLYIEVKQLMDHKTAQKKYLYGHIAYNDSHSHDEVLQLVREVIDDLKREHTA